MIARRVMGSRGLLNLVYCWCGLLSLAASTVNSAAASLGESESRLPAINPSGTIEEFSPVPSIRVRFTALTTNGGNCVLDELEVFTEDPALGNVASLAAGATVSSSGSSKSGGGYPAEQIADGLFGHRHGWIADREDNAWVEVEFAESQLISRIIWSRDRTGRRFDRTPIAYRIEVQSEGGEWRTIASSVGRRPGLIYESERVPPFPETLDTERTAQTRRAVAVHWNEESFAPTLAKYLRFTIDEWTHDRPVLDELEIYTTNDALGNVALASNGTTARLTTTTERANAGRSSARLIDGRYGEASSWRGGAESPCWVEFQLPSVMEVNRVVWSRDRTGRKLSGLPVGYRIEVATEPNEWREVASSENRKVSNRFTFSPQATAPADYFVDTWKEDDETPLNSIRDFAQTPDGYLWLATDSGLLRFDGYRFRRFDHHNTPEIATEKISVLHVDKTGRLWLANQRHFFDSRDNLVVYQNGVFRRFDLKQRYRIEGFYEEVDGQLWFKTQFGLVPWRNGDLRFDEILHRFDLRTFKYSDSGNPQDGTDLLWNRPIGRWSNGRFVPLYPRSEVPKALARSSHVLRQFARADGGRWLLESNGESAADAGHGDQWRFLSAEGVLSEPTIIPKYSEKSRIRAWISDRVNNLWFAMGGGVLYRLSPDGKEQTEFKTLTGLAAGNVTNLFEDRDGNIWMATKNEGLKRLRPRLFRAIDSRQGMRSPYASSIADNVYSVAPANDGGVWIGTHSSGAFYWNDHQLSQLKNAYTFTWSILEDPRGIVWTGTYGRGVKLHFQNQVSILGNPENHSLSSLVDSQDRVWTGGDYGVQCFAGDQVHRYIPPSFNKVGSEWVVSLAEAPDGAIWMGTKLGYLHKFTQNGFEALLTPGDGRAYPICGLHFGLNGALWLVRYGFGLSRIADGQVSHFARAEGLPTTTMNGILNDPRGFLWFTSKQGVYRIGHDAFARFAGGEGRASDWQRFTEQDGLPSNSCHGEQNQPSLCLTEDGRVWVPTLNGVGVIDPNELSGYARPPSVVIQEVTRFGEDEGGVAMLVDGESVTQPDGEPKLLSIPPGSNNLRIRYTAIDFTEPTEVSFSYRLLGLDDQWVDAENERAALVAGLGSGSYRFELRARNHLGQTSEVVSLGMVVQPFWWEKTSFRFAVVAMFALAGFAWYRVRIGQLQQRSLVQAAFSRQLIEREESERKRIAQELHDSLGHELLLVRNRALDGANRSELPAVQEQFSDISELAGNALENARGMAYNLRPFELDRIGFRKAVETMISKTASVSGTRYFKDIDELDGVLSSVQLLYLYRLIQEGLNNILKHAQASVVMLEVKVEDQHVRVRLDDNGVGFDSKVAKSGMGLNGMEERAKLIGGDFRVDSAQGEGTRVRIEIPV